MEVADTSTTDQSMEAKQIAIHLALGLLRQDRAIQKGTAGPVTVLDEQLQWGWDKLALLCHKHKVAPPRHLRELVDWLHRPIETWETIGLLFEAANLHGPLLYYGAPSELCNDLGQDFCSSPDPERELQDVAFKEILAYCQNHHLTEPYTLARRFLVDHPYLPHGGIVISASLDFDHEIRKWLLQAYEPIPMICRQIIDSQEHIALCPRCGWPLEWRTRHRATCYSELCNRLVSNLHDPQQWEPVSAEAMRTTRGIQSSIVAPEKPLLKLYTQLTEEFGLKCELWPEVDNYDLYLELPGGERWAVDMKDVASPTRLAAEVGHFRNVPEWDKAFFVFPEHRRHADYMRTFRAHWIRPLDTDAVFTPEFLQLVQERIG